MKFTSKELGAIAPLADRQMRRWALSIQTQERLAPERALARFAEDVHPYVAISREAGAGGGEIGRMVAERLGIECLDQQLLTHLAERYGSSERWLDFVDEKTSGWIREVVLLWLDKRVVTQDEYVQQISELALLAVRHASVVFVGRGLQFLLPRDRGVAVRVIAPLELRIAHTMEQLALSREAAERHVRETDEGRASLVRRYFHMNIGDPCLYDVVANLECLDRTTIANVIADVFRQRFRLSAV